MVGVYVPKIGQGIPVAGLESDRIVKALGRRAGDEPGVAEIAQSIVSIWNEIDMALGPILGERGVAMLYKRSLFLTGAAHEWLPRVTEALPTALDLAPLEAALMQQGNTVALHGGSALFRTFYELLSSLVGPSLTERLLRPIWDNS
ncbi:MAG TPA: hypothetical protein VK519_00675 [Pinirhizobacter sp.]|uniref:hypothetical protein n=1 Tax=Pinirhizobacter sp. TaxID=2950432 RepID=UPI002CA7D353|nr:hypothetical protein [Pinirhizobacter sp.]HMH66411.1 hypothetical protein [Pinirhizobacter sp.]